MAGFASRLLDAALEDGDMRGPLSGMFPADLPVPSFASALAPLIGKLPKVEPNVGQLAKMAWRKAGSIQSQFPSLSRDECAAITLYTMEDIPRERSPYYVMNAALREKNRQVVRPWRDFVWLMLHALRKLPPSKARIVVRGSRGTASQLGISSLTEGTEVQWSAFSSTATKVDVMAIFLVDPDDENADTSGPRTMIHLELTEPIGRDVSAFSLHPGECEVLLPPNICFEVVSHYDAGSGLLMVQCRQTESLDALLDFGRSAPPAPITPLAKLSLGPPASGDVSPMPGPERMKASLPHHEIVYASGISKPSDAAFRRLFVKVGGSLEVALKSNDMGWVGFGLDAQDATAVAYIVSVSGVLTEFRLNYNKIGDEGAKAIGKALKVNTAVLTKLCLALNGISDEGAKALASALRVNGVLTDLDLSVNYISDEGAKALASALRVNGVLTSLNVGGNKIGPTGATAIAEALRGNGALTDLNLGENNIRSEGAKALASALRVNEVLTELWLDVNGIGDEGAKALASALRVNAVLTKIVLGGNNLGDEGKGVIRDAVSGRVGFELKIRG